VRITDVKELWGQAAGRCSLCRKPLVRELPLTGRFILGEQAHIIAASPNGPRGESGPGEEGYDNLILLCPDCHRLIDKAPADHPESVLRQRKEEHELWVRRALPAHLPAPLIWSVPHPANRIIEGRDADLSGLASRLVENPTQVLHGMPGVGKSQIAVRFARERSRDYALVWWLDATTPIVLARDLKDLADQLDIPIAVTEHAPSLVEAMRRWLGENPAWLLIFDNASGPAALDALLPDVPGGHVLITSTQPAWRPLAASVKVEVLTPPLASRYLLGRTGSEDAVAALRLAELLGGFPVALEQAAAYVDASEVTLAGYVRLFEVAAGPLLDAGPGPTDYGRTVGLTVRLAIESVEQAHRAEAHGLLRLLAFLDPTRLERSALLALARSTPEAVGLGDEISAGLTLGALGARSLVDLEPDAVTVHSLVGQVVRNLLSPEEERAWVRSAQEGMSGALGEGDPQVASTFQLYATLLPHVLAVCGHAERLGVCDENTVILLDRAATHLRTQGQFEPAKELFDRALAVAGRQEMPKRLRRTVMVNRADVLLGLDRNKARTAMLELLDSLGDGPAGERETDIVRADVQTNLAFALYLDGDIQEADRGNKFALALYRRTYSESEQPDSKAYVDAVNNAGLYAWALNRSDEARRAWREGLELLDAAEDPDPLQRARLLGNLGVLLEQDSPAESLELHREAYDLRSAHLPQDHPDLIQGLTNLAGAYRALGELTSDRGLLDDALRLHEQAEHSAKRRFGVDHPEVANVLHNQSLDLWKAGTLGDAERRQRAALRIFHDAYNAGHPTLLRGHVVLGRILLDGGDAEGAEESFEETLRQWRGTDLPFHHLQVALAHDGLGRAATAQHDRKAACEHFRLAYRAFLEGAGEDAPSTRRAAERVREWCDQAGGGAGSR
jgi:tetratricopeptide (TPR) repeat protein